MKKKSLAVLIALALAAAALPAAAYEEPPFLAAKVEAGALPPIDQRLPATPLVVDLAAMGKVPGRYGGTLRTLMGRAQDTRMLVVYGYARLVGYDHTWNLLPDILERYDVVDGRVFTFHLRKGHKWSDGHPFTSRDFQYYWEDVLNNEDMSPGGMPAFLKVDGQPPTFEIIDETTVRYSWHRPNPHFLPALAGARPEYMYQPAHYLKQFHVRHAEADDLQRKVAAAGQRNWVALHFRNSQKYKNENPDLPSLQPWILVTQPPASRFEFARNPYYHRVDAAGRQLPYIDTVSFTVVNTKLIPAKAASGDSDLQARGLGFENYAVLKQGEKRHNYKVLLWRSASGSEMALYPNLNISDPLWRELVRDARFRQALSLAIDRDEINQTIYFGLGEPGGNTVLKESPLYRPEFARRWAEFDLDRANQLLDEMGLDRRDGGGLRVLPDGRPLDIIVETAGEDPSETDVLQLIRDGWRQIGIRLHIKPLQREVFRNRIFSGETLMSIWKGLENAVPTPAMSPHELAPTAQMQYHWPKWGLHQESGGQAGEPVDLPAAQELLALYAAWQSTFDAEERTGIWKTMLSIHADQVFSIGIVRGVPQPVVVTNRLRNVPETAIYNWEPGAHFGVHRPDTFWFAE